MLISRPTIKGPTTGTGAHGFRNWFASSKVVDPAGNPKVMYHGTNVWEMPDGRHLGDITVFDRLWATKVFNRKPGIDTVGSWFSDNPGPNGAGMYAGNAIYPVYLSIQRPWTVTFEGIQRTANRLLGRDRETKLDGEAVERLRQWMRETGADGINIVHDDWAANQSTEFKGQDAWIALDPQQVKSAIGNSGDFDSDNQDIRFSFAGENAVTAELEALQSAKFRIAGGERPEPVRQATGWSEGVDGKWRFEISDANARLLPALRSLSGLSGDGKEIKALTYRSHPDGTYDLVLVPPNPQKLRDLVCLYSVTIEVLDALLPEDVFAAILDGAGSPDYIGDFEDGKRLDSPFFFQGFNALPLDKVLDHPALFAAYPALRALLVQVDPSLGRGGAFIISTDGTQSVRVGTALQINALFHEIQHGIQNIEGFATGGTLAMTGGDTVAYYRLAGEVEARNTEKRLNMTALERRTTSPLMTADTPEHEMVITFEVEPVQSSIATDQVKASEKEIPMATSDSMRAAIAQILANSNQELPGGRGGFLVCTSAQLPKAWMAAQPDPGRLSVSESPGRPPLESSEQQTMDRLIKAAQFNAAQAIFDPLSRATAFLVDRIPAGREASVFLHEITHKHGRNALGGPAWLSLLNGVKRWAQCDQGSMERKIHDAAHARTRKATSSPQHFDEELLAYSVEIAVQYGVKPSAEAIQGSAEQWLDAVVQSVRQVVRKLTGQAPAELSMQDVVDLAYALAQLDTPEHSVKIRSALDAALARVALTSPPASANFQAWFKDSQARDGTKPLMLFHGTSDSFNTFNGNESGRHFSGMSVPQDGFWFADQPPRAEWYASMGARGLGGNNLMPVYLAMFNPYVHTAEAYLHEGLYGLPEVYHLQKEGYDGIIIERAEYLSDDSYEFTIPSRDFAVFRPEQIKSAIGNSGAYDPNDADIRRSVRDEELGGEFEEIPSYAPAP